MMLPFFRNSLLLVLLLSLTFVGCGPRAPYPVVPLEGTITFRGTPLENVTLQFNVGDFRPSGAFVAVGGEGKFQAVHTRDQLGVPVGEVTMFVFWAPGDAVPQPPEYAELFARYGAGSEGYVFELTRANRNFVIDLE